jgi:prepilin peptidase CpaA
MPDPALLPLLLLAPLLCVVGYFDLRYMRIPNVLSIVALLLFGVCVVVAPPDDLQMRVAAGAAVFALGFLGFAFGLLGGGDVKILACLVLFIPFAGLPDFARHFAWALSIGIAALLLLRQVPALRRSSWRGFAERRGYPMGISIAAAGIGHTALAMVAT